MPQLADALAEAEQAFKYRADQAREPEGTPIGGRFADEGKGTGGGQLAGPGAGTAPTVPRRSPPSAWMVAGAEQLATRIQQALPPGGGATVSPHPVAIRAAGEVAEVLNEMRAAGYRMPRHVSVLIDEKGLHGITSMFGGPNIDLFMPANLPSDISLEDAQRAAWKAAGMEGHVAAMSFRDVVIHEMGHVIHAHLPRLRDSFRSDVAAQVSPYAAKDYGEFLAETFTRLYRGDRLPADVISYYTQLGGQPPRRRAPT